MIQQCAAARTAASRPAVASSAQVEEAVTDGWLVAASVDSAGAQAPGSCVLWKGAGAPGASCGPVLCPHSGRPTDRQTGRERQRERERDGEKESWGWKSSAARSGSPPTGRRAFCDGLNERAPTSSQVRPTSLLSHSLPEIRMGNGASYGSDLSSWRRGLRPFLRRVDQGGGRREGGGGRVEV